MNGVKFVRENGGLNRLLSGEDHISGLVVIGEAALESQLVLSVEELAEKGITVAAMPVTFYQINEFFRINPGAKLYVKGVKTSDATYSEVKQLQNFAEGKLRRVAVCDFKRAASELSAAVGSLNQVAKDLRALNIPLSTFLSVKVAAQDMAALPSLHTLDAENVSVVLGQDMGGLGRFLSGANPSLSAIGAVLGASSKAKVHESIAWVEKQNLVSGAYSKLLADNNELAREMDVLGFCDGSLLSSYTPQQIQEMNENGYIFGIKYAGQAGSYFNDSFTATKKDSDFAYIENNTTVDKAIREINRVLTPKISSPVYIDPDTGFLENSSVSALEALCDDVLDQMVREGEISGYKVYINPAQQILRDSKLEVVLKIVPVGTLREITVKIGLTLTTN
ncbi:DUF2586 family protein [Chryseobacterium sp. YR221]|uniref:DUF2586 family protein n=1 Tax=Chryseobacterium sp. YR221 TaxID=1500293 RepID=UPI0009D82342|nr:DUF2586 family protein [Chryseobacterium sp. YR221]SMC75354.1 hypothetical protein SAMN02787074_2858 [Chryseobacterium sp. YR221]